MRFEPIFFVRLPWWGWGYVAVGLLVLILGAEIYWRDPPPPKTPHERVRPVPPPRFVHPMIEPTAYIRPAWSLDEVLTIVTTVRASGYRCDTVSLFGEIPWEGGIQLKCNQSRYSYAIRDRGGQVSVTIE